MTRQRFSELTKDTRVHLGLVITILIATYWLGSDRSELNARVARNAEAVAMIRQMNDTVTRVDVKVTDLNRRIDRVERRIEEMGDRRYGGR